jgi:tetratricopeptide (TPR) repeat protein
MSRKPKKRKRSRRPRSTQRSRAARPSSTYRRNVRQADEILAKEGVEIRADNWQELALEWFAPYEPERSGLAAFMAAREDRLGVRWARELLRLEVFTQAEDGSQIMAHYDRAFARYPRCAVVEMWVADPVFRYAGDLWRARQMYRYAARHLPDHFKPYQELGFLSYLVGDFPGALRWYEQAAERVDDEHEEMGARILHNLGLMRYFVDGDKVAAIDDLKEALRRYPDYPEAKHTLRALRQKSIRLLPW